MAATLQELEQALVNADRAGDAQAARVLAAAVIKARQVPAQAAPIPGTENVDAMLSAERAKPAPSLADQAIGVGEAGLSLLTGATGGMVGMVGGTVKGMAEQLLNGQFGTPQAANAVEQAAAAGAQAFTYAPRTEQGQAMAASAGQAMQQLVPLAGLVPQMAALSRGMAPATAAAVDATRAGVSKAAPVVKAATTLPRRAMESLRRPEEGSAATPGTMGSMGAAGTDMATQRTATAESLGLTGNAALTKGQATRNPAQLKFEVETAKMPDEGAPLRQRLLNQNAAILDTFDHWIDQTGATAPNLRAVGGVVDSALVKAAKRDKTEVNVAYAAAKRSPEARALVNQDTAVSLGDGEGAITGTPIQFLNGQPTGLPNTGLADAARQYAVRLGIAEMQDGQLVPRPATIRQMEDWRQAIGQATGYEPADIRTATILKAMIDGQTEPVAGPLFRQARATRRRYAQNYEDRATVAKLLQKVRGTEDRRVALEDVFDHTILKGSLDDVRNVRRVMQSSGPEGEQAWRELQGATAKWVKEQAERNVATDSRGNRVVSADGLDKAIKTLDADGRLDFIFGKKGAQQMRDINELAKIARTVPPEAAINFSNTAATLLTGMGDVVLSGVSGVPAPIATVGRLGVKYIKDAKLRQRINEALGEQAAKQARARVKVTPVDPSGGSAPPGTTIQ